MHLTERTTGSLDSAYNYFPNAIVEACDTGIWLETTAGNQFIGGTSEGNDTLGMLIDSGANLNVIRGMDFESNNGGLPDGNDVDVGGWQNTLDSIASDSLVRFLATSKFNVLVSAKCFSLEWVSGAIMNIARDTVYDRHGVTEATLTDNGTDTIKDNLMNLRLGTIERAGGRAAYNSELDDSEPSLTGTTHLYTNNTGKPVVALLSGGLVTRFVLGRPAGTFLTMPVGEFSAGSYYLSPLDTIDLDYTSGFPPGLVIRAI